MKSHLIGLIILLLILPDLVSAEMVTLQNCVIDTGAYILPIDLGTGKYRLIDPLHLDSDVVLAEGIYWMSDNSVSGIKIYELSAQKTINYTIQQRELASFMQVKTGKNVTPEFVTKPYPGWVASCRVNDTTTILTGYLGEVTPKLGVLLMTEERPDIAAYILSNLKVIPKAQEGAAITQSVASSLK